MSSLIVEVCKVQSVEKHPNADKLSVVLVKGWNCIVGLDQYKVGELVVFVPPDCVIPNNLIEKYNLEYLKHNGRTGTVKLRGYLSQGLILDLPEGRWKEGDDVSSVLGITKWIPPEPKYYVGTHRVSRKKINPFFDKYTDIENIKNYPNIFTEDDTVIITEKIHGSNARYGNLAIVISKEQPFLERMIASFQKYILGRTHQFVYGSHNVQIGSSANRRSYYGEDIWGKIAKRYSLANRIPKDYILYGEIFGEGIQDLKYGITGIDLRLFDIKYKNHYLSYPDFRDFCEQFGFDYVPVIYTGKWYPELISEYTNGKSLFCPDQMREGIVIKSFIEENHPAIGRKILKSISTDYLLRKNGTEYQ